MTAREIAVPKVLRERDQWVLWRYEGRKGKATKVPYEAGLQRASSTDPRTWSNFDAIMREWHCKPDLYSGPGFVFSPQDPFCGVDLDDALDSEGNVKPWAHGIVERFSDTYMEISPGGAGLKIWVRGGVPVNLAGVKVGDGQIEIYDHARYFAVTGRIFRSVPLGVVDHSADVLALYEHLTRRRPCRWTLQPLPGGRIPYGQQHSTLVSIAGTLRARRVCDEAIEACLQIINARQCERPGSQDNIARIVKSSRRWGVMA
jgi:Primase C terminal 1 (PriCT-1)